MSKTLWINVSDKLPTQWLDVLVIIKSGTDFRHEICHLAGIFWRPVVYDQIRGTVTHWMPLPEFINPIKPPN